jgi:hypothetical protein
MLLATKRTRTANKGTHIYNVPHFAPPHPEYTHAHKRSWNAEDVKKNAASLSYSQMDRSQCIAFYPLGSACQCLQPWLLLGFSHTIASRTLPPLRQKTKNYFAFWRANCACAHVFVLVIGVFGKKVHVVWYCEEGYYLCMKFGMSNYKMHFNCTYKDMCLEEARLFCLDPSK